VVPQTLRRFGHHRRQPQQMQRRDPCGPWYPAVMATTKKPTSTAKPASRARGRSASNGIAPIRGKARREAIEALIELTTKDMGLSPEVAATLKDDAWGKRLVDP
jgi:hypothetical protein